MTYNLEILITVLFLFIRLMKTRLLLKTLSAVDDITFWNIKYKINK